MKNDCRMVDWSQRVLLGKIFIAALMLLPTSPVHSAAVLPYGPKCQTHVIYDYTVDPPAVYVSCVDNGCTVACAPTAYGLPGTTIYQCTCGGHPSECCDLRVLFIEGIGILEQATGKCSETDGSCDEGSECVLEEETYGTPLEKEDVWAECADEEE